MTCQPGYQRDARGACHPTCSLGALDCGEHGSCQDIDGISSCVCQRGYAGTSCRACGDGYQDNDEDGVCLATCALQPADICGKHGRCDDALGYATCVCEPGYQGDACERCAQGYQDTDGDGVCEQTCLLYASTCSAHSACDDSTGHTRCVCEEGYDGTRCDVCASGYQDDNADQLCQPSCALISSTCSASEICVDVGKPAVCTSYPASCAQALAFGAQDGIVDLFVDNDPAKPWEAFCVEMNSPSPKTYLPLRQTSGLSNRFQLVDQDGLIAQSEYWMVRVDPLTLEVLVQDTTGARTAYYRQMSTETVPYGALEACTGGSSSDVMARGRIDLTHTPFQITEPFAGHGSCPNALAVDNGQVRALEVQSTSTVEGACAGIGSLALRERFGETCGGTTLQSADVTRDVSRALTLAYLAPVPSIRDYPKTCLELELGSPSASDGTHTLYLDGDPSRPWLVDCEGMQGLASDYISQLKNPNVRHEDPREYIEISAQDSDSNLIEDGGNNTYPVSRETRYSKLRFDPRLFEVDVLDTTFATWTTIDPNGSQTPQRYGHVAACSSLACTGSYPGRAKLDLRGTPLRFEDTFLERVGCQPVMTTNSASNQVIELLTDDTVGEVAPARAGCGARQLPYYSDGRFYLRLAPL